VLANGMEMMAVVEPLTLKPFWDRISRRLIHFAGSMFKDRAADEDSSPYVRKGRLPMEDRHKNPAAQDPDVEPWTDLEVPWFSWLLWPCVTLVVLGIGAFLRERWRTW